MRSLIPLLVAAFLAAPSAFAQVQGDIFQQRVVMQTFHPQQRLFAVRRTRGRIDIAQHVAEHLLDDRFAA